MTPRALSKTQASPDRSHKAPLRGQSVRQAEVSAARAEEDLGAGPAEEDLQGEEAAVAVLRCAADPSAGLRASRP